MVRERADLDALLSPESVAVVGASPDSWYSSQLVDNLLEYGYDGPLYLVNPGRDEAWGRQCYDELDDVPEVVDLVVVSVPREHVTGVVEQAGQRGVSAALIITAGFAESGSEGEKLEAELTETVKAHDIRVCGPNCIGLANMHEGTVLTSTCSREPSQGSIGLVSHSGALAFTTFFERGEDEDTGFAYIVSTGNEIDQTLTDYVEYLGADEQVDVITTYVEGIEAPREFMRVADEVTREGTPVLTVKIGQSEQADTATLSHTGSLTGNDDAWQAAFAQTGVQRVSGIADLLAKARAHATFDTPDSNNVCVASTSGGLGSLLADMAELNGLSLPALSERTEQELLDLEGLMTFGSVPNPADIRGYGADYLPEIADALLTDDQFDAYLFAIGLSAVDERAEHIADDLVRVAEMADDPVFFLWTGRKTAMDDYDGALPYERLRQVSPLYYDPKRCIEALASLVEFGEYQATTAERPSLASLQTDRTSRDDYDLPADSVLQWSEATELLSAYDIDAVSGQLATDADEAVSAAEAVGFPVVMKVDSPEVPHRSRIDAVRTGVTDPESAQVAYRTIVENTREAQPDAEIGGIIVQPQITEGVEVLLGVSTDDDFGPLVTVGSGGTFAEAIEDDETLVPPFSVADARSALSRTNIPDMLSERGLTASERLLAELLVDVGNLAVDVETLAELDLNPVIINEDGLNVVDVLVRSR